MRIGFSLPQSGAHAHHYDQLPGYAKTLEDLGADSLWVSDRILAPVNPTVGYAGGDTIPEAFHSILDPLALVSAIGAITSRVQIGTNVLIAPWYPPILLARMLTTLDVITKGRLVVGLGTGWSPEEYQSVGVPMNQRGARLEECLDILERYWSDNPVEYTGKYWTIPPTYVARKPVQQPHPPVYLAAFAPAAFSRVGRRADGWMPAVMPSDDFDTTMLKQSLAVIRAEAEKAGRDPEAINAVMRVNPRPGYTLDSVLTTFNRARDEAGIEHAYLDVAPITSSPDEALELAQQVLTAIKA
jgi:probable F420-dependent oxidoreductase